MRALLLVFLGAGLGGVLRHLATLAAARHLGALPWGTALVNVAGSFAMGLLVAGLARLDAPWGGEARLLLGAGLLGGFTTFSAFSLDAVALWERGETGLAAAYVGGSVAASLAALAVGLALARG